MQNSHEAECSFLTCTSKIMSRKKNKKQNPWSESVRELYRLSDRLLSAKLVPTFSDKGVSRGQLDGTAVISVL
jgi:hypothetical protein